MKTTVKGVLAVTVTVAGMTLGVGLAGPANATIAVIGSTGDMNPYHYRDELRYSGLHHEDVSNASELGPRICRQRITGYSEDDLISSLMGPDPLYNAEQAVQIVMGAERHLSGLLRRMS